MKQRESITGPLSEDDYAKVVERVRLLATACILPAYYLYQACTHQQRQMRLHTAGRQPVPIQSLSGPCSAGDFSGRVWAGQGPGWHPRITSYHPRPHASSHSRRTPLSPTTYQVRAAFPGLE